MKKITLAFLCALFAPVMGCSGDASGTAGGAGGEGGSSSGGGGGGGTGGSDTTSSSSSTTATLGPVAGCTGSTPFAPFDEALDQEMFPDIMLVDESGAPLDENGALACRRFVPPVVPFTFDDWAFTFTVGPYPCGIAPDTAVSFVAPIDAAWPIVAGASNQYVESTVDPNGPKNVTITTSATVSSSMDAFYACVRLPIDDSGDRACVDACSLPDGKENDEDSLFSDTVNGKCDPLPTIRLAPLYDSPTKPIADYFGSGTYQWGYTAHGHSS